MASLIDSLKGKHSQLSSIRLFQAVDGANQSSRRSVSVLIPVSTSRKRENGLFLDVDAKQRRKQEQRG